MTHWQTGLESDGLATVTATWPGVPGGLLALALAGQPEGGRPRPVTRAGAATRDRDSCQWGQGPGLGAWGSPCVPIRFNFSNHHGIGAAHTNTTN